MRKEEVFEYIGLLAERLTQIYKALETGEILTREQEELVKKVYLVFEAEDKEANE